MLIVVGEIIQELLKAHHEGKDVNLNRLKTRISSNYGLESAPRLVDIIAAVPHEAKSILLPKLRAKPIRTASGVSGAAVCRSNGRFSHDFLLCTLRLLWLPLCANHTAVRTST